MHMHPLQLLARLVWFRDDGVALKFQGQSLETIKASLENVYDLKLQVEGEGTEWNTLEAHSRVKGDTGEQHIVDILASA